ncbi:PTS system, maltose and glucose-specific IIC component and IIB component [Vibrio ponticus]|nr:PTS system, maltose and glucose-specific IIC component and IIB component [Vibrio ponticus]
MQGLGGVENIADLSNCATRLRVTVKDPAKVESPEYFMSTGAVNLVKNGNAVQVIIGLSVPQLREECEKIVSVYKAEQKVDELTPSPAS